MTTGYRAVIRPESAFITPLKGDTLFGQLCWSFLHLRGEAALTDLLDGYTANRPWLVVSDAFPHGYLPRPAIPAGLLGFDSDNPRIRKQQKGCQWLPVGNHNEPLTAWHRYLLPADSLAKSLGIEGSLWRDERQMHNSINRQTGTTGRDGGFAPFAREPRWYAPGLTLDLYLVADSDRTDSELLSNLLNSLGSTGFGKEASAGLGKFSLVSLAPWQWLTTGNAWLTLAPTTPQGMAWDSTHCFYSTFTRFGRHGDRAVHSKNPFKKPVLMADTAAVLTPATGTGRQRFTGQGLSHLSLALPATVHQGYAPVVPVNLGLSSK